MTDQQTKTKPAATPPETNKGITTRADVELLGQITGSERLPAQAFLPQSFAEVLEMAKLMATCGTAVPGHFRNKPGDCLAIIMQALRWRMDPFAVAAKTYFVPNQKTGSEQIAFEAQLVNAVVNQSGVLNGRLHIEWEGEGEALHCRVTGYIKGDDRPKVTSQPIATITTRNSPLWKSAPKQQLGYFTTRMWARLYTPEVLLGVYTPEEVAELTTAKNTPATILPPVERPKRSDYEIFPTQAAEKPQDALEAHPAEQPTPEPEATPPAPARDASWDVVDNDGEVHPHSRAELATNFLIRLIERCRNAKQIDGLIDSNMAVLGRLPEDLEQRLNESIALRQEAVAGTPKPGAKLV